MITFGQYIRMYNFRVSLKRFLLMITAMVLLLACTAHYWPIGSRPAPRHVIILESSNNYVPVTLTAEDLTRALHQLVPTPNKRESQLIKAALAHGKVRVMPYGINTIEIVAGGETWQMEPASVELLARAAAYSIKQSALAEGVTMIAVGETSTRRL